MEKSPDAFRTISEVADWLGIQAHVLRFWESKFTQMKPVKRAGGRRYYRPADMQLIGGIKKLLYDDGLTIKGVQKILREQGIAHVSSFSPSLDDDSAGPAKTGPNVVKFLGVPAGALDHVEHAPDPEPPVSDTPEPPSPPEPVTTEPTTDPAPEITVEPAEPETEDTPTLPAFLHRPRQPAKPPADADTPKVSATPPRPIVVDTPEPTPESEIPVTPGVLAHLAGLRSLTLDQAQAILPLATQLLTYYERLSADGKD
jgi:DNA-binding transcriptional MerR regulator